MQTINHAKATKCYQWFIWIILGMIALTIIFQPANKNALVAVAYIAYAIIAYHWAVALNKNKWLWAILGLIPIVNFISLLILANTTHKVCKADGVKLGFFGGIKS